MTIHTLLSPLEILERLLKEKMTLDSEIQCSGRTATPKDFETIDGLFEEAWTSLTLWRDWGSKKQ